MSVDRKSGSRPKKQGQKRKVEVDIERVAPKRVCVEAYGRTHYVQHITERDDIRVQREDARSRRGVRCVWINNLVPTAIDKQKRQSLMRMIREAEAIPATPCVERCTETILLQDSKSTVAVDISPGFKREFRKAMGKDDTGKAVAVLQFADSYLPSGTKWRMLFDIDPIGSLNGHPYKEVIAL